MKKIFAIILSLILLILSGCSAEEAISDGDGKSEPITDLSNAVSENDESTSNDSSDTSEERLGVSESSEPTQLEEIKVEHGVYTFYDNGKGEYTTEFDTINNEENGNLTLILKDGRSVELVYGEIVYDESDGIHKTTINGLSFWIEDITDGDGKMLQILECIERPERSIFVHYYPELDCGDMTIVFDYEADGTEYTFNYADGNSSVKTILYDEEAEEYYFG